MKFFLVKLEIKLIENKVETQPANLISMLNLRNSVKKLTAMSPYIQTEMENGNLGLVAAFYDTKTGKVTFDKLKEVKATG